MPPIECSSLILSLGVAVTAGLLLVWQMVERRGRPGQEQVADFKHYVWQDFRRTCVALVMLLLAVGVYVGSRLPHRVHGRPNMQYVGTWAGVMGLVVALLALALLDWSATRRYAARHREAIVREGMEILRDELLRRKALGAGRGPAGPTDGTSEGAGGAG